jgi:hypothetical protein
MMFNARAGKSIPKILGLAGVAGAALIAAVAYNLTSASAATGRAQEPTAATAAAAKPAASGAANLIIGEWSNSYGKIVIQQTATDTFTSTSVTPVHLIGGSGCAVAAGTSFGTITGKGPSYSGSVTTYDPDGCTPVGVETLAFAIEGTGNALSESGETWTRVPFGITTAKLPGGVKGDFYSNALGATGGQPPYYLWRLAKGSLPRGLTLNELTGVISGIPTSKETVSIAVAVSNLSLPSRPAPGGSVTKTLTLSIS